MANFISSTQHDHVLHKYDAIACLNSSEADVHLNPLSTRVRKHWRRIKFIFNARKVEMGRFRVKVLCGSLFTLPISDNTDKKWKLIVNIYRLSKSTFRFKFENKSTNRWITLNLTVGQVKDLQPFIVEYVQWWMFRFHYTCGTEWVSLRS